MATLPNGDKAVVPASKLEGYALNAEHADGGHKARVFRAVLGITAENADVLRAKLLEVAATADATEKGQNPFGSRYEIRFTMRGPNGNTADVISGWFIDDGGDGNPRLTSCYVDL